MTANLVIWKWNVESDSAAKRKKQRIKNGDVATGLLHDETHPAAAPFDQQKLVDAIDAMYPIPEEDRVFVIERYPLHIVVNVALPSRVEVLSKIGPLAMRHGLNGAEALRQIGDRHKVI